jgi:hypothetical protein
MLADLIARLRGPSATANASGIFWPHPPRASVSTESLDLGLEVAQGGGHYRAFIGNPAEYDWMGAYQFDYMVRLGLREQNSLLDIGCGSLRGGRLFIPYLLPDRYFGLEPHRWLVEQAIANEVGASILEVKRPVFLFDDHFSCSRFGRTFDFVLAHSVFSHAAPQHIVRCLHEARQCLTRTSLFAATYLPGGTNYEGDAWLYPECSTYTPERIREFADAADLTCVEHERHFYPQQWVLFKLPD